MITHNLCSNSKNLLDSYSKEYAGCNLYRSNHNHATTIECKDDEENDLVFEVVDAAYRSSGIFCNKIYSYANNYIDMYNTDNDIYKYLRYIVYLSGSSTAQTLKYLNNTNDKYFNKKAYFNTQQIQYTGAPASVGKTTLEAKYKYYSLNLDYILNGYIHPIFSQSANLANDLWIKTHNNDDNCNAIDYNTLLDEVPAIKHCRNLNLDINNGNWNIPNFLESMIIFMLSDKLDLMDPTASIYPTKCLGVMNPNGRFCLDGTDGIWISTPQNTWSSVNRFVSLGYIDKYSATDSEGGYLPIRELISNWSSDPHIFSNAGANIYVNNNNTAIIMEWDSVKGYRRKVAIAKANTRTLTPLCNDSPTSREMNSPDILPNNADYTAFITGSTVTDPLKSDLPVITNEEFKRLWTKLSEDNTMKENCDAWLSIYGDKMLAINMARNVTINGQICNIPDLECLMMIYLNSDYIDSFDDTVKNNVNFALGRGILYKRFGDNNVKLAWSCTRYTNHIYCVEYNGIVSYTYYSYSGLVIPVLDLV